MKTATKKQAAPAVRRVQIGTASVDSGMLMIVDPCYVLRDNYAEKHGWKKGYDAATESSYEKAMDLCYSGSDTLQATGEKTSDGKTVVKRIGVFNPLDEITPEEHRQIAYGAVCTTGKGDGEYPVYAVYEGNTLVGMEVRFRRN